MFIYIYKSLKHLLSIYIYIYDYHYYIYLNIEYSGRRQNFIGKYKYIL